MNLSRHQILEGNYIYPTELVTLKPTKHFKERLENRGLDLECIPSVIRITKDNIHSAKTEDNKHLHSVVVRLKYNKKYMYICYNPFDGGAKSIWFSERGK